MDAQTMTYVLLGVAIVGAIILILVTIEDRKYIADLRNRNETQREVNIAERRMFAARDAMYQTMQSLAELRGETLGTVQEINRLLTIENEALMGKAIPVTDEIEVVPAVAPEEPAPLKPINLTCPYCGARPGESCVTAKGQPRNLHRAARKQRVEGA